jgi:hypothetical protein
MSRATLIIDGKTRIDDDLQEWHKRPPEILADMVKPGAKREPYLIAAAMALVEATAANQPITITVETNTAGWAMLVEHKQP